MGINEDIAGALGDIMSAPWDVRSGREVPETKDVLLRNGAVQLTATYLYADMCDSTTLAQRVSPELAARVIRLYLNMAVRVIKHSGGEVRSFDGDRVMGIFVGGSKNTSAARVAMGINYYVQQVLRDKIAKKLPETKRIGWTLSHGIGIDTGEAFIVRGGVRNDNDLVSVGQAPNVAAKLSDIRDAAPIHLSSGVYGSINDSVKKHKDGRYRFTLCGAKTLGGRSVKVYSSTWYWMP